MYAMTPYLPVLPQMPIFSPGWMVRLTLLRTGSVGLCNCC